LRRFGGSEDGGVGRGDRGRRGDRPRPRGRGGRRLDGFRGRRGGGGGGARAQLDVEALDVGGEHARRGDGDALARRRGLDGLGERGRGGEAVVRRSREGAHARGGDRLGDGGAHLPRRLVLPAEDLLHHGAVVLAADEAHAGEQLPEQHAGGVDVG